MPERDDDGPANDLYARKRPRHYVLVALFGIGLIGLAALFLLLYVPDRPGGASVPSVGGQP